MCGRGARQAGGRGAEIHHLPRDSRTTPRARVELETQLGAIPLWGRRDRLQGIHFNVPHHAPKVLPGKVRACAWIDAWLGAPHAQVTTAGRVRRGVWSYFTRTGDSESRCAVRSVKWAKGASGRGSLVSHGGRCCVSSWCRSPYPERKHARGGVTVRP